MNKKGAIGSGKAMEFIFIMGFIAAAIFLIYPILTNEWLRYATFAFVFYLVIKRVGLIGK